MNVSTEKLMHFYDFLSVKEKGFNTYWVFLMLAIKLLYAQNQGLSKRLNSVKIFNFYYRKSSYLIAEYLSLLQKFEMAH